MALVRQDLQTKVTDAFAHLNTRAPIARKRTVGKKAFLIWWNTFMKNSTSPLKLSIDESKCQSYSANYSSVCSSRCLNPLLSLLFSYPSVWLSGWLSCRVFFLPNSHFFVKKLIHHICAGSFPISKMDTNDATYSLLWSKRWFVWFLSNFQSG